MVTLRVTEVTDGDRPENGVCHRAGVWSYRRFSESMTEVTHGSVSPRMHMRARARARLVPPAFFLQPYLTILSVTSVIEGVK